MLGANRYQHSREHVQSAKIISFPETPEFRQEKEIQQLQEVLLACEVRRQDGGLLTGAECWKVAERMHARVIEKVGQL